MLEIHFMVQWSSYKSSPSISRPCKFPLCPMKPRKLSFWAQEDEILTIWDKLRQRMLRSQKIYTVSCLLNSGSANPSQAQSSASVNYPIMQNSSVSLKIWEIESNLSFFCQEHVRLWCFAAQIQLFFTQQFSVCTSGFKLMADPNQSQLDLSLIIKLGHFNDLPNVKKVSN